MQANKHKGAGTAPATPPRGREISCGRTSARIPSFFMNGDEQTSSGSAKREKGKSRCSWETAAGNKSLPEMIYASSKEHRVGKEFLAGCKRATPGKAVCRHFSGMNHRHSEPLSPGCCQKAGRGKRCVLGSDAKPRRHIHGARAEPRQGERPLERQNLPRVFTDPS